MSRNRFEALLSNLHFAKNEAIEDNGRLRKVLPLVEKLTATYQKVFSPGADIVIDETMVPWRGRLVFRHYELAQKNLNCKTHVVGTVRYNKNNMPAEVMSHPLKKGEMVAKEDQNGIVVLKWRDVRDVRTLSTKHEPVMVPTTDSKSKARASKLKPLAVMAYNIGKSGIDRSDQMVSYATNIRKSIKWYRKLALHLLLGTSVVNAHIVFQKATNIKIHIRTFREMLVKVWLEEDNSTPVQNKAKKPRKTIHHLEVRNNQQGNPVR
uniref:DDE_Tnp_1_7 domain-containing protein n=1 Tax=Anopheles christyi TaxID=43041 RepID=A0A182KB20_9DIPT